MPKDAKTGRGFCLVMRLREPAKLVELMQKLDARRPEIRRALGSLDYVHYARFIPLFNAGLLLIVTEFDGDAKDYVMDFAAVLNEEFSTILGYMEGMEGKLPVSDHPEEFWKYVEQNSRIDPEHPFDDPFSPYPDKSVLDIVGTGRRKALPPMPPVAGAAVELSDVQANVVRRYRSKRALHLFVRFTDPKLARQSVECLRATSTEQAEKAGHCVNIGFTHAGLAALGVPQDTLDTFPEAFRQGPRVRAQGLGDDGPSDPSRWRVGGDPHQDADAIHAVVSLYTDDIDKHLAGLGDCLQQHAVTVVCQQATASLGGSKVHFGYRDGISQPRIEGVPDPERSPLQPASVPGDFLLGELYTNSRGGRYSSQVRSELAKNGTYAALRIIKQHVKAFDKMLVDAARDHGLDPELVAAKLMGRWRDGSPLIDYPQQPAGDLAIKRMKPDALEGYDYVGSHGHGDDNAGLRCPMGSHMRRLNPRGGMAVGVPWGRRVLRRGMPYGSQSDEECGLVGLFLCADLEDQFEFLQRVWANKDLSAPGLRGTTEPFVGSRSGSTPFRFRVSDTSEEVTLCVPPLTQTVGSLYLFMPGMAALSWIATEGWAPAPAAAA
jgi:Dyp-type peroxidase family